MNSDKPNVVTPTLESYFSPFRKQVVGHDTSFDTPYGKMKLLYADWTASGRLYTPIEEKLAFQIGPYVANTHTETTLTGTTITMAYHHAKDIIKRHVNATDSDVLITANSGMTGVINKFQRILGMKLHEKFEDKIDIPKEDCPVILVTHMEHHSNQTSWLETISEVVVIKPNSEGLPDLAHLKELISQYPNRQKIAAITSCSNVTGIQTPYYDIARIMHENDGLCFVDFAAAAPYINIDMNPDHPLEYLDAIYFSPHKFLGGPGSSGVLLFKEFLYQNRVPDNPGGGTVNWTNPWGEHSYVNEIEAREDGGTPGFMQTIRTALSIQLKEEMGVQNILAREHELFHLIWPRLKKIEGLHLLADHLADRLGIFSFYIEHVHYNLVVKLLNDRFGIQTRGGCSCAGTYGHYLLEVSYQKSHTITSAIGSGDLSEKPGWVRLSIHPIMTDEEAVFLVDALEAIAANYQVWAKDYVYDKQKNEFYHKASLDVENQLIETWFGVD